MYLIKHVDNYPTSNSLFASYFGFNNLDRFRGCPNVEVLGRLKLIQVFIGICLVVVSL